MDVTYVIFSIAGTMTNTLSQLRGIIYIRDTKFTNGVVEPIRKNKALYHQVIDIPSRIVRQRIVTSQRWVVC